MVAKKIGLEDLGRLVKPKVLTEVFLRCILDEDRHVDPYDWWLQVNKLARSSKTYKKDMLVGTYGQGLSTLFGSLDINSYVGVICSFIVFQGGEYHDVNTSEEVQRILLGNSRGWSIRAVGVKIYRSYDYSKLSPLMPWEPTGSEVINWYYRPRHLVPIEDVEQFNNVAEGDLIVFKKTQALVIKVKTLRRPRFYNSCSWTAKKVTVLSGGQANQVRLVTNRPYEVIQAKRSRQSSPENPSEEEEEEKLESSSASSCSSSS